MEPTQLIRNAFNSYTFRAFVIFILILILFIPQKMITSLVSERTYRSIAATSEITQSWGKSQQVNGPILCIPYEVNVIQDKLSKLETRYLYLLPENLNIEGKINPNILYRKIYKAIVYSSNLNINGKFDVIEAAKNFPKDCYRIAWDDATVQFNLSDYKGIKDILKINFGNNSYELKPEQSDFFGNALVSKVNIAADSSVNFSMNFQLNGSEQIEFTPIGKQTKVAISSHWSTPSFYGSFLPENREVKDSSFTANWNVLYTNRQYGNILFEKPESFDTETLGVKFLFPINPYQSTGRAVDYAILIIGASFLVFFLFEVLRKRKIHTIQYLLVGISLCIFYTLLLSLSEHVGFNLSYLIASSATIGLITFYSISVFKEKMAAALMSVSLICLYGYIYIMLQMEDYALLTGSIGMFVVMAIVMFLTRKINWYGNTISNE